MQIERSLLSGTLKPMTRLSFQGHKPKYRRPKSRNEAQQRAASLNTDILPKTSILKWQCSTLNRAVRRFNKRRQSMLCSTTSILEAGGAGLYCMGASSPVRASGHSASSSAALCDDANAASSHPLHHAHDRRAQDQSFARQSGDRPAVASFRLARSGSGKPAG